MLGPAHGVPGPSGSCLREAIGAQLLVCGRCWAVGPRLPAKPRPPLRGSHPVAPCLLSLGLTLTGFLYGSWNSTLTRQAEASEHLPQAGRYSEAKHPAEHQKSPSAGDSKFGGRKLLFGTRREMTPGQPSGLALVQLTSEKYRVKIHLDLFLATGPFNRSVLAISIFSQKR